MTVDEMNAKYGKPAVSVTQQDGGLSELEQAWGSTPVAPEQSMSQKVFGTAKAALGGIGEGVGGIALTGLEKLGGALGHPMDLHAQFKEQMGGNEHPTAYGAGQLGGEVAALAAPVSAIGKVAKVGAEALGAGKKVSTLVKAGTEGAAFTAGQGATENKHQSLEDYALNTGLNVAFPVAGMAAKGLADKIAPRIINSLIKPLAKEFSYGKDPGKSIAELGITGNNFDDLINNIKTAKQEQGQAIGDVMSKYDAPVELQQVFKSIDDALDSAHKTPRTNAALIARLEGVKDDLAENVGAGTLQDAQALKGMVGDLTKWTGNASDDATVNKALKSVYGTIRSKMDESLEKVMSPEEFAAYKKSSDHYGNLISAENAAIYRDKINERQNMISFGAKNAGLIGALGTAIATGGAAIPTLLAGLGITALDKAAATPFFKTNLAKLLVKMAPDEVKTFFEKIPTAKSLFDKSQIDDLLNKKAVAGAGAAATTLGTASAAEDKNGITPQEDFMKQYPDGLNKKQSTLPIEKPMPANSSVSSNVPKYSVREGKVKISDEDLHELGAILFGEVGNRDYSKKILESKTIANIAINRMIREGKSLKQILQAPNQFQAFKGKQYNLYKSGKAQTEATSSEKVKAIQEILDQIKEGKLVNTAGDNQAYMHLKDKSIRMYKDWNEQKKDLNKL